MRVRQRDDLYIHEVLGHGVIDGLLVSKAIVDGRAGAAGKYTLAQRHRLYRVGIRRFFRLEGTPPDFQTMGDCGAFSYVNEEEPPYTPDAVIDFYDECDFDIGIAPTTSSLASSRTTRPDPDQLKTWKLRPGTDRYIWPTNSGAKPGARSAIYAHGRGPRMESTIVCVSVAELQAVGYKRIALGGMVPLKTHEIISSLKRNRAIPNGRRNSSARDNAGGSHRRIRRTRRDELRQHLRVPAVLQGRSR